MAHTGSITPSFVLKVLAPSLVAAGGIAVLLLYIVNGIFEETNRLDAAYAQRLTGQAISSVRDGLAPLVHDNALWDDAAEHAGSAVDKDWADETWGFASALGVYDAAFVIDRQGRTLYGAVGGKRSETPASQYFGSDLQILMERVLVGTDTAQAATGIVKAPGGLTSVAVGSIRWSSEAAGHGASKNLLVFGRLIDNQVLTGLARRYAMENLRFADSGEQASAAAAIFSPSDEAIGLLAWTARSPGDVVRDRYGYVVSMILLMFVFVIVVLIYTSWKGFKDAHESQAEAVSASRRDDLTGLANRREMLQALRRRLEDVRASGMPLSVIYADLDGFKEVNDSYGHKIGDMLLRSAAAGFEVLAQGADVVARLGGDEFAVILTGPEASAKARVVAQNMIDFLAEPMVLDGRIASVSVSIGIVDLEGDDADMEEIIRRADVAMYAAKAQGRNCTHVYQKSLDFKRDENRAIATQLRSHIERGILHVVYQPIVDARSRRTKGVEALVRWPRNEESYYGPDVFIPVAEEFGLIEELGTFVLKEACRQAAQWRDIFVSVNVSPIQFMNPNFADLVLETLVETGLEARRLELEVTEGFIIDNASRANSIINRLHEMHVRVALDDFGTGFSSIGHLRRFKFDKLKLDRSMVIDILRQPSALRLVQGTIAMADALGLTVVAEGIEDENQVSVLRLAGCGQFQGYLFSRPVEGKQITAFLSDETQAMSA